MYDNSPGGEKTVNRSDKITQATLRPSLTPKIGHVTVDVHAFVRCLCNVTRRKPNNMHAVCKAVDLSRVKMSKLNAKTPPPTLDSGNAPRIIVTAIAPDMKSMG